MRRGELSMSMWEYKTYKTRMGRKVTVKLSPEAVRERKLYWTTVVLLPFISSALAFLIWVKVGG